MQITLQPRLGAAALAAILVSLPAHAQAAAEASPAALAEAAYDRADYAEARRLLEPIDAAGDATPVQIYQLYFSQRATGSADAAATLERARLALDLDWREKPDLETGFYLANAYTSAGLNEDAKKIATDVVSRLSAGQLTVTTGEDQFRAAKLFADAGNDLEAASRFRKAISTLDETDSVENDGYIAWASRWLADRAAATGDWSAAEIHLTTLLEHAKGTAADYEKLAMARVRNEMYAEAATAWQSAMAADRANSDRARYAARLCQTATRIKTMPRASGTSKPFAEMSREELEAFMGEQARTARQVRADAEAEGVAKDPVRRKEVQRQLASLRAPFVAAGLEYTLRGWSLQEAAFVGGFAPLIFRDAEWRAPREPKTEAESEEVATEEAEGTAPDGG